jgi:hypothetical protein
MKLRKARIGDWAYDIELDVAGRISEIKESGELSINVVKIPDRSSMPVQDKIDTVITAIILFRELWPYAVMLWWNIVLLVGNEEAKKKASLKLRAYKAIEEAKKVVS